LFPQRGSAFATEASIISLRIKYCEPVVPLQQLLLMLASSSGIVMRFCGQHHLLRKCATMCRRTMFIKVHTPGDSQFSRQTITLAQDRTRDSAVNSKP
jgi:hypothetical protein